MTTPQQFLESFLHEKAAAYAEANARLSSVYQKYFGEPLLHHANHFLLHKAEEVIEHVKQSSDSAVIITHQHLNPGAIRLRYHLAAAHESWKIVRLERECFFCHSTGRVGNSVCEKCGGEGWYSPRLTGTNPLHMPEGGIPSKLADRLRRR